MDIIQDVLENITGARSVNLLLLTNVLMIRINISYMLYIICLGSLYQMF